MPRMIFVEPLEYEYGRYQTAKRILTIDPDQSAAEMFLTVCHECMHAMSDSIGGNFADEILEKAWLDMGHVRRGTMYQKAVRTAVGYDLHNMYYNNPEELLPHIFENVLSGSRSKYAENVVKVLIERYGM